MPPYKSSTDELFSCIISHIMILQIIKLHTLRLKGLSSTQLVPHTKFLEQMNLVVSLFNLVANILYQCLEIFCNVREKLFVTLKSLCLSSTAALVF